MAYDEPDEHQPADEELARRAAGKDEQAFAALFDRYYERVRAFAYRSVLDPAAADDVAQETFIRVARSLTALRDGQAFRAWLFRITAHLLHDEGRRKARRRGLEEALAMEAEAHAPEPHDDAAAAEDAAHGANARLHAALGTLPEAQREAVALVYFDTFTHAEAARALGCAESTISWRIYLAKGRLKKLLKKPLSGATR